MTRLACEMQIWRNMRLLAISIFLFCTFLTRPLAAADKAQVVSTMRSNFETLMKLQPFVADPKKFADPENREEIQGLLDNLSGLKHVFKESMNEQEPGLAAVSTLFSDYLKDMQEGFSHGASAGYVRNQLRTMTGFCMSCHTRVATDKNFEDAQKKVESSDLKPFQKAEFYAATRQFDNALASFDKIISNTPEGEAGLIETSHALKNALSITVRVKQDPKATYYLLEKLASRRDLPEFMRREVAEWKKDTQAWMKEKKPAKTASADTLIAKARGLVERAGKIQLYAADHAGDISYLRATNAIHEALQRNPRSPERAEALYLLGVCYSALQDPLLWALDELYFEACVREFPHTKTSKSCYQRYASKVYWGYSGSGGTFVPDEELKKLKALRTLAE